MNRRKPTRMVWAALAVAVWPGGVLAQERVADTPHNLSVTGPGKIRAAGERQICVFCHAPHHTSGDRPLWNRSLPTTSYTIYESSTLDAHPGQPTGASKLCLSCHDGTIALGSVLSRADRIRMVGGDFLPAGLSNLGTDLSDDHPVSFHYTSGIAASDRQLRDPVGLPPEVKLDATGQLQCTACHDPHSNVNSDFLVKSNAFGALCLACHDPDGWSDSSHRNVNAPMPPSAKVDWPHATMSENACRSCHRSHAAGGRERLLIFEEEEANCLSCHGGAGTATNILADLNKISAHDPRRYLGIHDPVEMLGGDRPHVECVDCHNPHASSKASPETGYQSISPTMALVKGVTIGGSPIEHAQYEYEVCLRCHGENAMTTSRRIARQVNTANLRLKISPTNASYHPVANTVRSSDTVSLVPGLAAGSMIRCTDCHNSDQTGAGSAARGPHGSMHEYLLERNYTVQDDTPEGEYEYAMCYKCHLRNSILGDESFPEHRLHIVEESTPCSACHDAHGISAAAGRVGGDHTHLINFDTMIVRPNRDTGVLAFRDLGTFAGSCTLVCHGRTHLNEAYGN